MTLHSRLERKCFNSSCMYIEPEFSKKKIDSQLLWILLPSQSLEKEVPYVMCIEISSANLSVWSILIQRCILTNYLHMCMQEHMWHIKLKFNGAENLKVLYGRYSYHMWEGLHAIYSCKTPDVIGIGNSMKNPGVMSLVTYTHVIWVELHGLRRCKISVLSMCCTLSHAKRSLFNRNRK